MTHTLTNSSTYCMLWGQASETKHNSLLIMISSLIIEEMIGKPVLQIKNSSDGSVSVGVRAWLNINENLASLCSNTIKAKIMMG